MARKRKEVREEEQEKRAKKKQKKKEKKEKKKEKKQKKEEQRKNKREKNAENGAPCLPDDPNLLNIILDYALCAQADELDHPLRAVNRATRHAWLAHPISLPFRLRLSLGASSPAARLPLAQRLRLVAMFECALANFGHAAKSELKRQRREKARGRSLGQLLARVDKWEGARKKVSKEEIAELRAEARKLIGRATDVEITSRHQYGDNVYCWSQYQVSFQIEGEDFKVARGETQSTFCPYDDEITIPEVERLAELREEWQTPLHADTLHCLFSFLLPYDDIAHAYDFHMIILSSQSEDEISVTSE